jgi:hypothetical protein
LISFCPLAIAADSTGGKQAMNGYLDGLRITKYARYTSAFTSPPIPSTCTDLTRSKNVGTLTGGVDYNFSNGGSLVFDGTNDYVNIPASTNLTFGTGTSAADAASLRGAGLTTLSGKLAVTQAPISTSTTPTITDDSRAQTFVWTGGTGTFTIPAAATLTPGWFINFRNNGNGAVNIIGTGLSQINNQPNVTINPGDSGTLMFQSSTGNFFTVGLSTPSNVTFTSATYDVDAVIGDTFNLVAYAPIIQTYVAVSGARTTSLNVVLPATTQLYILLNDTAAAYAITFQISGSSQTPIPLAPGSVITVLSDGNFLYLLSTNTTSFYYAANGTAAVPSFTFLNDISTGMYLDDDKILGFTANGANMMLLDNSEPLDPQVYVRGAFTALGGIKGGEF